MVICKHLRKRRRCDSVFRYGAIVSIRKFERNGDTVVELVKRLQSPDDDALIQLMRRGSRLPLWARAASDAGCAEVCMTTASDISSDCLSEHEKANQGVDRHASLETFQYSSNILRD